MLAQQETKTILGSKVKKRAVLYARTSGNDKNVDSLPSQLDVCEQYANEQGYIIVDRLSEDIKGVSGGDKSAPALNKALEMAQAGLYDVLIIRDVKRYSRDVYKSMDFESRFFDCGIEIEYVWNKELNGLPRRGTGFIMRFLQYWMAEEDRQHIVQKLYFKRVETVARKGRVLTHGKPPYGYDEIVVKDGAKIIDRQLGINEGEAYWVRKIFEWYVVDGLSLRQIAMKLQDNKVLKPSIAKKSQQHKKINKGGVFEWSHVTIKEILIRRVYMGEYEYSKKSRRKAKSKVNSIIADDIVATPIICEVPAIVDLKLWEAAQDKLAKNKTGKRAKSPHIFLMRHRASCKVCGGAMIAKAHKVRGKYYFQYRCSHTDHKKTGHTERCNLGQFKRDRVDAAIWQWLTNLMNDDNELKKGFEDYQNDTTSKTEPLKAELSRIDDNLKDCYDNLAKQAQTITVLTEIGSTHAVDALKADILKIEKMIDVYTSEKKRVEAELKAVGNTGKIEDFDKFVKEIRGRMERAKDKPKAQEKIIQALDVTCDFMLVDGKKAFKPKCVARDSDLDVIVYSSEDVFTTHTIVLSKLFFYDDLI